MGMDSLGANNDGVHVHCASCLRLAPASEFSHPADLCAGCRWPLSLGPRSLRPRVSLRATNLRLCVVGVCANQSPHAHIHRHWPPFYTSPFHFASPQHKRTLRFPHAQVLERIKQGYQYLLPSICVEIFSKEGAAAGEKPYGVVSCSRGIRRCILRACNS